MPVPFAAAVPLITGGAGALSGLFGGLAGASAEKDRAKLEAELAKLGLSMEALQNLVFSGPLQDQARHAMMQRLQQAPVPLQRDPNSVFNSGRALGSPMQAPAPTPGIDQGRLQQGLDQYKLGAGGFDPDLLNQLLARLGFPQGVTPNAQGTLSPGPTALEIGGANRQRDKDFLREQLKRVLGNTPFGGGNAAPAAPSGIPNVPGLFNRPYSGPGRI